MIATRDLGPLAKETSQDHLIALITDAAYQSALRQGIRGSFLDFQLNLWRAIGQVFDQARGDLALERLLDRLSHSSDFLEHGRFHRHDGGKPA